MLKKLLFPIALTLFPLSTLAQTSERITEINNVLNHIAKTKMDIMLDTQMVIALKNKAEKHFLKIMQENYNPAKQACLDSLQVITSSPEFITTLEQVTNKEAHLISKDMVQYNDIIIDSSAYPLEQKIKSVLSTAAYDNQMEQLFNVFYVAFAVSRSSKILLAKLKLIETELIAEREALQASNQTPDN